MNARIAATFRNAERRIQYTTLHFLVGFGHLCIEHAMLLTKGYIGQGDSR